MTRPLLAALLFFLCASAFAETADLRVRIDAPAAIDRRQPLAWTATVTNGGPEFARTVVLRAFVGSFDAPCETLERATLAPGASMSVSCRLENLDGYTVNLFADAASVSDDPFPEDNVAQARVDLLTPPDLYVFPSVLSPLDQGLPYDLEVTYFNIARTAATGVVLTVTAPEGGSFLRVPANCRVEGDRARCDLGVVEPSATSFIDYRRLAFQLRAPDVSEALVSSKIEIRANEPDVHPQSNVTEARSFTYRTFFVTNTNDAGAGSLRAAIEAANGSCQNALADCKVAFRIAGDGPWRTIVPESPLPRSIAARTSIDATTQTKYIGDTNAKGPEIELDGSRLAEGANGLEFETTCLGTVSGLAINGFRGGNGIYVAGGGGECRYWFSFSIAGNYIGTDPTGTVAVPNFRGVYLDRATQLVERNLISGNTRSGIYAPIGTQRIHQNRIGVNATVTAPLPNGASGIYLGPLGHGCDVTDNYIGFNADQGIAIEPGAGALSINGNSFQANGALAIDYNLDGVSSGDRVLPIPEITAAYYDAPHGRTTVEGRVGRLRGTQEINVYANDAPDPSGFGEGQYTLGRVTANPDGTFTFVWHGRLPGPWVTATATHMEILFAKPAAGGRPQPNDIAAGRVAATSEFSRAVRAE